MGIEAGDRIAPARRHRGAQSGFVSDNSGLSAGPEPYCNQEGNGGQPTRDQNMAESTLNTAREDMLRNPPAASESQ
jgi:hypothetical protein